MLQIGLVTLVGLAAATGRFRNYIRLSCGVEWSPRIATAMEKLGRIVSRQM